MRWTWVFFVLLVSFLAYVPSVGNDFTWDDRLIAAAEADGATNDLVAHVHPVSDYFRHHYWHGRARASRLYRPITILSFALGNRVCGRSANAAHWINTVLNVVCTWLVILILLRLRLPWQPACLGALAFGLHALHSEAVIGIVGRSELLGFAFGATGLLLFLQATRRSALWRAVLLALAAAAYFVGCCSKESALAWLPFSVCVAAARTWQRGIRVRIQRRHAPEIVALLVPAIAFLALRYFVLAQFGDTDLTTTALENPLMDLGLSARVMTATMIWGWALLLTLFPFSLSSEYGMGVFPIVAGPHSIAFPWFFLAAAVFACLLAAALLWRRRFPLLFVVVACWMGFSFVVSNIPAAVTLTFGERNYYAPSFAIAVLVAWLASAVRLRANSTQAAFGAATFGAWLGACGLVIAHRTSAWKSNATLVAADLANHPNSVRLLLCRGQEQLAAGLYIAATRTFERAARGDPGYADSWSKLGIALHNRGQNMEAIAAFDRALHCRPRSLRNIEGEVYLNRGLALAKLGRSADAIAAFERARLLGKGARVIAHVADRALRRIADDDDAPASLRTRARVLRSGRSRGTAAPPGR